ncbi:MULTISPECIES: hypothetical protein [Parachlamydia]|uniref:hypothetical protein n=1 Tax=Parachlamydia TaxID=83551 RepID=UPI0001C173E8|nr:hypothetical protein [Parachlamydia acanthamoebae]EFB41093.1 hypothetical protein pah_c050o050 [Parachlamydia acanthamoebae str. Hall's coccus]
MGFSATGSLLKGSSLRPDILTGVLVDDKNVYIRSGLNSRLNILGYIPVISSLSGYGRLGLGTVHAVIHLPLTFRKKNRKHHLAEMKLGLKNMGRGAIEMIPLINITLIAVDRLRMRRDEKKALKQINNDILAFVNKGTLFAYGQVASTQTLQELDDKSIKWVKKGKMHGYDLQK